MKNSNITRASTSFLACHIALRKNLNH